MAQVEGARFPAEARTARGSQSRTLSARAGALRAATRPCLAPSLPGAPFAWIRGESRRFQSARQDVFIVSFFVLGGDFGDKVRALFVYSAKAAFPPAQPTIAQRL